MVRRGPQLLEHSDRANGVAGIVVVEVAIDRRAAIDHAPDVGDPPPHVARAVDDEMIPAPRPFLDSFAVSEPANVGEIGSQDVALLKNFVDTEEPRMVDEGKSHAVLPQEVEERWCHEALVADLDGEAHLPWEGGEESLQEVDERLRVREFGLLEVAELKEERSELIS